MASHVTPQSVFADEHFATHWARYLRGFVNFSHVRHITLKYKHQQLISEKQECIPVGCVPSAAAAVSWGGGLPGECLPRGGMSAQGCVSA